MITTRGLTKTFDGRTAISDLTMHIEEGEIFGLLGPNGAGKTTTVRMLAALIQPTAGQAVVNGFRLGQEDTQIRRSIGLLTEVPGLYDRLSAWKNLELYAQLHSVKDTPGQVEKYLRWLGLWDRRMDNAGALSKGMKQKLAIGRALLHEPKVLFLDEPTSGLDPQTTKSLRDFIAHLREEKRTILLCTHNLDEAARLCDRIAVVNTSLVVVDKPETLRQKLFGRRTIIQLVGLSEEAISAARSFDFVKGIERQGDRLIITLDDPERQNPLLIGGLVAAGAQIQFVSEQEHSLEEIYLKLVG